MLDEIERALSAEGAFSEMSSAGCLDNPEIIKPSRQNTQIKFQDPAPSEFDAEITCASMRADELRGCLIFEISRIIAIGRLAQEALLDSDDDMALANLRWHWRVTRAGITPLACELAALRQARAPP